MKTRHIAAGTVAGALLLLSAAPADAANVTVRVEGNPLVVEPVAVATVPSVTKTDANGVSASCAKPSIATALEPAVGGQWTSDNTYGALSVLGIKGENRPFGSGSYWSAYINGTYQNTSICDATVVDGDEVVLFASDDPYIAGVGGYDEPLTAKAPAKVAPGTAFPVTVKESVTTFDNGGTGTTTQPVSAGATVTAGAVSATTGANGIATLTLTERGPVKLVTTKGNRAPDRDTVCVTDGADGFCGTTKPDGTTQPGSTPTTDTPCVTNGFDGFCGTKDTFAAPGRITSVKEGARFAEGKGPRTLGGSVAADPSGVRQITLRLTRNDGGRCSYFSGRKEVWVTTKRCRASAGFFFKAAETADWTYLLPEKLGRGRYVLDVRATDKSGNADTKLDRGRNRIVFRVG